MSIESDLVTVLKTVTAQVFPDVAPVGTVPPYITWQQVGGTPLVYVDKNRMDKRWPHIQINTWAATRAEALTLSLAVEAALLAASAFNATALSDLLAAHDDGGTDRRGYLQDFSLLGPR